MPQRALLHWLPQRRATARKREGMGVARFWIVYCFGTFSIDHHASQPCGSPNWHDLP